MFYTLPLSLKIFLNLSSILAVNKKQLQNFESEEVKSSFFSFTNQSVSLILQIH